MLDAHTVFWYWTSPPFLGPAAFRAFETLENDAAIGLIPAIAVLEVDRILLKHGQLRPLPSVLRLIDQSSALRLDPFTRRHVDACLRLDDLPEIHDRMIASAALVHGATLITRDETLRRHPLLQTDW